MATKIGTSSSSLVRTELDDTHAVMMAGQDLVVVKKTGTPSKKAEIHIYTAANQSRIKRRRPEMAYCHLG